MTYCNNLENLPPPSLRPTPIFLQAIHDGDFYFILSTIDNTWTLLRFRKYQKTIIMKSQTPFFLWSPVTQKLLLPSLILFNENLSRYKHIHTFFFPTKIVDLCMLFCTWFPTEQSILEIFTSVLIQLPPFNGYIIFHCMDVPQIIWWTFSCFQLFATKNNDSTTIDNGWGRGYWVSPISGFPFFHTREFYKGHISQPPLQLGVATWLNSGHGCKQMHMWGFLGTSLERKQMYPLYLLHLHLARKHCEMNKNNYWCPVQGPLLHYIRLWQSLSYFTTLWVVKYCQ